MCLSQLSANRSEEPVRISVCHCWIARANKAVRLATMLGSQTTTYPSEEYLQSLRGLDAGTGTPIAFAPIVERHFTTEMTRNLAQLQYPLALSRTTHFHRPITAAGDVNGRKSAPIL
jgi:hypothetical protein